MSAGKLTVITPPDKLYNFDLGYLLVNPSNELKIQLQKILSHLADEDINIFIYENNETNIEWLLGVSRQVDVVIVDIDNCDELTRNFISFLLCLPNSFYLTTGEIIPWGLINKNRIYNLDWILDAIPNIGDNQENRKDDNV